jgi:hypothetical protein
MSRTLLWLGTIGLIIVGGVVHGWRTDRWSMAEVRQQMYQRVAQFPKDLRDWKGDDLPVLDRHKRVADADIVISRRYQKAIPGGDTLQVVMVLFSGRPQPMSVHTPDFCFPGYGYRMQGAAQIHPLEPERQQSFSFWFARFLDPEGAPRRVYWSWGDGRIWRASSDPRREFAHCRGLYKLYLVTPSLRVVNGNEIDDVQIFLRETFPELQERLSLPEPRP